VVVTAMSPPERIKFRGGPLTPPRTPFVRGMRVDAGDLRRRAEPDAPGSFPAVSTAAPVCGPASPPLPIPMPDDRHHCDARQQEAVGTRFYNRADPRQSFDA